jgi:peptidyl-lysine (3S)-dioxygenase / protease
MTVFAKPHEEEQPFCDFLDHIVAQEKDDQAQPDGEVRYAQTREAALFEGALFWSYL